MSTTSSFYCQTKKSHSQRWSHLRPRTSNTRRKCCYLIFSNINPLLHYRYYSCFHGSSTHTKQETTKLGELFPCFSSCIPFVFEDESFDFNFMSFLISFDQYCFLYKLTRYIKKKETIWKDNGIFDLIQLLRASLKYNSHMLVAAIYLWKTSTNMFDLPCRMVIPTLFANNGYI